MMMDVDNHVERARRLRRSTILHEAVEKGNVESVSIILNTGGSDFINYLDANLRTPIHIAIQMRSNDIVRLFLLNHRDVINDNQFLINYTISHGSMSTLMLLTDYLPLEIRNRSNMTAFCIAFYQNKFEILDYLLSLRMDVDTSSTNYNDRAIFYVAIIAGNLELAKKFVESGVPINASIAPDPNGWRIINDHAGFRPLHLAVKYLRGDIVELLLNRGADVSMINDDGSTALHVAFEVKMRGMWKSLQDLATNDMIIDTILDIKSENFGKLIDKNQISHLHIACSRDRPEVIESALLDERIDVSDFLFSDARGFTCLHFAAKYGCDKVAELLIRKGMRPDIGDNDSRTPLHIASKGTSLEVVQVLMRHGADLCYLDIDGNTPVHLAFNDGNYAILDLLLTHPAFRISNPTDTLGLSHFHIACTRNDVDLIQSFIDIGTADVNLKVALYHNIRSDWDGCVPLHFAIAFNRVKNVELLLNRGADVHISDAQGFYPIHVACQQNYYKFEQIINETVQSCKNADFNQNLECILIEMENKYKGTKMIDYPLRFPSASSQLELYNNKTAKTIVIDWKANRIEQIKIIKMLITQGADLNVIDDFGNSPLYYIYDFNIHKILDTLSQKLHLSEKLGSSIVRNLLIELYYRRSRLLKEIFQLEVSVNVNASYDENSLLHYICQENDFWDLEREPMVKYFLRKGANPDATTINLSRTPLHIVTKCHPSYDNLTIINHLLEANANVNAKMSNGTTPLHHLSGHPKNRILEEMMRTLLHYNANVNSRNSKGQTPIFLACLKANSQSVVDLLQHGADLNIKDNKRQTALCYFYNKYKLDVVSACTEISPEVRETVDCLKEHVQRMEEVDLYVNERVEILKRILIDARTSSIVRNEKAVLEDLRKQVEKLKEIKIVDNIFLHDVLLMKLHTVPGDILRTITKQLRNILLHSKVLCIDQIYDYFPLVKHKYNLGLERISLLSKIEESLKHLMVNFPVEGAYFFCKYLTNSDLHDFFNLLKLTDDKWKIKAYLRIRRIISGYEPLEDRTEFIINLIVPGSKC